MELPYNSLHGTVIRSGVIAGFAMSETGYAPRQRLPAHTHQLPYFCFVLRGHFTELRGRHRRDCGPSTLIFHPAGETHSDHFHTGARCFNLQVDARRAEIARRQPLVDGAPDPRGGGLLAQLAWRLYGEFRQPDELSPLVVEGLALEILGETARHCARRAGEGPPPWLERAREVLHDEFGECVSLSKVAASAGVHKTHLAREFRRHYRCTVGEYVRRLRVEFARRRLCESDAPLSEIALAAGFFDQSHFARTFRRCAGMSPADYRKTFGAR